MVLRELFNMYIIFLVQRGVLFSVLVIYTEEVIILIDIAVVFLILL